MRKGVMIRFGPLLAGIFLAISGVYLGKSGFMFLGVLDCLLACLFVYASVLTYTVPAGK